MIRLVGSAGFEPATFAVSGRRPNQASPTLRSVLDDEPWRHRQSHSVSSFPENTHEIFISRVTTNLLPTLQAKRSHENEKDSNHIACNRHHRLSHCYAYPRRSIRACCLCSH